MRPLRVWVVPPTVGTADASAARACAPGGGLGGRVRVHCVWGLWAVSGLVRVRCGWGWVAAVVSAAGNLLLVLLLLPNLLPRLPPLRLPDSWCARSVTMMTSWLP